jgi:hypothetical protein
MDKGDFLQDHVKHVDITSFDSTDARYVLYGQRHSDGGRHSREDDRG